MCSLAYLKRDDFLNILRNYPLEYEKFCVLRDSLIFNDKRIDIKCTSCGEYTHSFKNCSILHGSFNK